MNFQHQVRNAILRLWNYLFPQNIKVQYIQFSNISFKEKEPIILKWKIKGASFVQVDGQSLPTHGYKFYPEGYNNAIWIEYGNRTTKFTYKVVPTRTPLKETSEYVLDTDIINIPDQNNSKLKNIFTNSMIIYPEFIKPNYNSKLQDRARLTKKRFSDTISLFGDFTRFFPDTTPRVLSDYMSPLKSENSSSNFIQSYFNKLMPTNGQSEIKD